MTGISSKFRVAIFSGSGQEGAGYASSLRPIRVLSSMAKGKGESSTKANEGETGKEKGKNESNEHQEEELVNWNWCPI